MKKTRSLGVDYGLARIGLALSDEKKIIASPYAVLSVTKKQEETVKQLLQTIKEIEDDRCCHIDEIVFGLPLHMDGRLSFLSDEVQKFIHILTPKLPHTKIVTWEER